MRSVFYLNNCSTVPLYLIRSTGSSSSINSSSCTRDWYSSIRLLIIGLVCTGTAEGLVNM